jgi:hypothetical protein
MEGYWILFIFMAFAFIVIALVVMQYQQEQARRQRWLAVAETKGFRFSAEADPALLGAVGHFHLLSQGHSRKMTNVIRADVVDVAVSIFDYRYTTGSGKHSQTHLQTVALFEADRLRLPRFALRPEGWFHKVGDFFGYRDIDFDAYPAFSDTYLLRGEDEAQIRELFAPTVLSYYEGHSGLCTEGSGRQLLYYRAGRRIVPEEIEPFLQQGLDIVALFSGQDQAPQAIAGLDHVLEEAQAALQSLKTSTGT